MKIEKVIQGQRYRVKESNSGCTDYERAIREAVDKSSVYIIAGNPTTGGGLGRYVIHADGSQVGDCFCLFTSDLLPYEMEQPEIVVGKRYRIKKGHESVCPSCEGSLTTQGLKVTDVYVKVTQIDQFGGKCWYRLYNNKAEKIDFCGCYTAKDLEPYEETTSTLSSIYYHHINPVFGEAFDMKSPNIINISKGEDMGTLTPLAKKTLDAGTITLIEAGFLSTEQTIQSAGSQALTYLLFEKNKKELVVLAQEELDERKKNSK